MKTYKLSGIPGLKVHGRTDAGREPLTLFWTASGIEFAVDASEVRIRVRSCYTIYECFVDILVDGARTQRLMLDGPAGTPFEKEICVYRMMERGKTRTIRLMRDTQAMPADPDNLLQILDVSIDGEFRALPERKLSLEFIGDSITSGEGLCGAIGEMSWNSTCFDCVEDYTFRTARRMDADYDVISQSGWGVYCSWQGRREQSLPQFYEQTCGVLTEGRGIEFGAADSWDFAGHRKDVIVVNLGTNDGGSFEHYGEVDPADGFVSPMRRLEDGSMNEEDRQAIEDAATEFLGMLRRCNPGAYIIWAYGMCPGPMEPTIRRAIERHQALTGDKRVTFTALEGGSVGSREHPGAEVHEAAAIRLEAAIREALGLKEGRG